MTTIQEKRGSVQEGQNQKILDFATANFSSKTHEYGRDDMKGQVANKRGERIDPSRDNQDLDRDGRKGVDCSSLVYFAMKGAGFRVPNNASDFSTGTLFTGRKLTPYAEKNFDFLPSSSKTDGSLKPGDLLMMKMPSGSQHIVIFKEYDDKGRIHFFGSQKSTGPAEVIMTGDPYWDKRTVFYGALRPKENFIKPEFRLEPQQEKSGDFNTQINGLIERLQKGDTSALSQFVTNNGEQLEKLKQSSIENADVLNKLKEETLQQNTAVQQIEPETRGRSR